MAVPLCGKHTSSLNVGHPVVPVMVSVVTAVSQHLLFYTNMAPREGEGGE